MYACIRIKWEFPTSIVQASNICVASFTKVTNREKRPNFGVMEEERQSIHVTTKIMEPVITVPNPRALQQSSLALPPSVSGLSKYAQLLGVIEELGRDIRPTYASSRSSAERIKRGIVHARILVRECLIETERSARQ